MTGGPKPVESSFRDQRLGSPRVLQPTECPGLANRNGLRAPEYIESIQHRRKAVKLKGTPNDDQRGVLAQLLAQLIP